MVLGDFPMIEKNVDEAGQAAFDEFKEMGASDEIAEKARTSARGSALAHNNVVKALRDAGHRGTSSSSAPSPDTTASGSGGVVVQVMQSPTPERYDGISNLEDWFRRYEADARGAGWTELQMAERLGNHLRGVYFDVWHQNCSKVDFAKDRKDLIDMFALTQPDEILARFNSLTWNPSTKVVAFVTSLRRYLKEYNDTLSEQCKLTEGIMDCMVMDRLITNAPNTVKSALRRRRPKTIQEICQLFDDYKDKSLPTPTDTQVPGMSAGIDADNMDSEVLNGQFAKAVNALIASQSAMMYSLGKFLEGNQSTLKCDICSDKHLVSSCPFKKYESGCYVCSSTEHLSRACPQLPELMKSVPNKPTVESGNF
ncbi:hypothetical protein FOZ63_030477 [Perkinsus olseni]|uniref:CCHC-type domain-containing protein n=1 Tax=Perkinsus olseni TaxID=32597 RepID=A0A7J6S075_PEROL|nr:hypothetical protein FOZ60_015988 [Perkinsus olseni]KAF4708717.1 hypothetical protein FOZ62_028758 [Perkinsus olseni]KAF4725892.1 hypothetical protein FOZ63_030477 [Perkinsus olseni]